MLELTIAARDGHHCRIKSGIASPNGTFSEENWRAHGAAPRARTARDHSRIFTFQGENRPSAGCPHPVVSASLRGKIAFLTGVRVVSPYCILRRSLYLPPSTDPFPHE